ncbi:MAG TPA: protoheme IX farnesyltransferase [Verrucomicrobiales bacterium]|nr:protoheme IX farnesyltransferase [Verrucomicrobiales bacterium]
MKATEQAISEVPTVGKSVVSSWMELFKARLNALVLLTAMMGFYLGSTGAVDYRLMFHTLLGTSLLAAGAAALNSWLERDLDRLMSRTEDRPLPTGRIAPDVALMLGGGMVVVGLIYLAFLVQPLTALLGAVTLVSYVCIYTPLKRVTTLNTIIGAIPGAMPPLMGWTAAYGELSIKGWALFAILFFWQLPHFLAIAWMFRGDYARAGFKMLPVVDPEGVRTGRSAVSHTLGLLVISLFPFLYRMSGEWFLAGALVLGALFLACSIRFARRLDHASARTLFFASIIYLPLLLTILVLDKN